MEQCTTPQFYPRKRLCNRHYLQTRRFGKVRETTNRDERQAIVEGDIAKIPLGVKAKDGYVIVDKEFAYLADEKWSKSYHGYAVTARGARMHRVILGAVGEQIIDHLNLDKLDNRLSNLRFCTQAQNTQNTVPRSKTGLKGVSKHKTNSRFTAKITVDRKPIELGTFETAIQAARAYNQAARLYYGEHARLNNV